MMQVFTLARKEWYELRWFGIIGVVFFVCLPLPNLIDILRHSNSLTGAIEFEGPVLAFGGLYALIVALGVLCHDLKGSTFYFWTSRPIGLIAILMVKYLTGLVIVLCVCIIPLLINFILHGLSETTVPLYESHTFNVLLCHSFVVMLVFSMAFLMGALARQAAKAAVLSLSAGLTLYFLPTLFPVLERFSVFYHLLEGVIVRERSPWHGSRNVFSPEYTQFVFVTLLFSLTCLILSWQALKRNWRLNMNRHVIAWCLGSVILILAASTAFQLGSNMNCERQFPIPLTPQGMEQGVVRIASNQEAGVLLLYDYKPGWIAASANYSVISFDLSMTGAGIGSGYTTHIGRRPGTAGPDQDQLFWSPQNPARAYLLPAPVTGADVAAIADKELWTLALDAEDANNVIHKLKLNDPSVESNPNRATPLYLRGHAIYAYVDRRLLHIDLSHPDSPKVTQSTPIDGFGIRTDGDESYIGLRTLPLPDMSDGERFEISFNLAPGHDKLAYVSDLLVAATRQGITTYRIIDLDKALVRFETLGHVRISPLQRLAGFYPRRIIIHGDFAYVLNYESGVGGGLLAFDIRNPERPRQRGHYAAPRERFHSMAPLPEGKILVGGNNLHIVDPPKRR